MIELLIILEFQDNFKINKIPSSNQPSYSSSKVTSLRNPQEANPSSEDADFTVMKHNPTGSDHGKWFNQGNMNSQMYEFEKYAFVCEQG